MSTILDYEYKLTRDELSSTYPAGYMLNSRLLDIGSVTSAVYATDGLNDVKVVETTYKGIVGDSKIVIKPFFYYKIISGGRASAVATIKVNTTFLTTRHFGLETSGVGTTEGGLSFAAVTSQSSGTPITIELFVRCATTDTTSVTIGNISPGYREYITIEEYKI